MEKRRYTYGHRHFGEGKGEWFIQDMGDKGYCNHDDPVVFTMPFLPEHWELDVPPDEFRQKFEELCGRSEFAPVPEDATPNIVEMIADEDDCAWDQPCAFGHRVETHAVYCHNDKWLYSPRKCRRNRTDWPHEKCRGFKPNPLLRRVNA